MGPERRLYFIFQMLRVRTEQVQLYMVFKEPHVYTLSSTRL
jgi:hypothetical protein